MHSPDLIWDGEIDSGSRTAALVAVLESRRRPAGISFSRHESHSLVEVATRSYWAFATWAVSAIMIWFGLTSDNWFLLVLVPFMMGGAIMQSFGRVSILIEDGRVRVFEGVGGMGRRLEIPLRTIQRVEYAVKHGRFGSTTTWIALNDLKFGRHMNEEQIQFVIGFLLDAIRSLAS